jgi:hypothetical protein
MANAKAPCRLITKNLLGLLLGPDFLLSDYVEAVDVWRRENEQPRKSAALYHYPSR